MGIPAPGRRFAEWPPMPGRFNPPEARLERGGGAMTGAHIPRESPDELAAHRGHWNVARFPAAGPRAGCGLAP